MDGIQDLMPTNALRSSEKSLNTSRPSTDQHFAITIATHIWRVDSIVSIADASREHRSPERSETKSNCHEPELEVYFLYLPQDTRLPGGLFSLSFERCRVVIELYSTIC